MRQEKSLKLKDDEKIIGVFFDIEGHRAANRKALSEAFVNPEHGYYIRRNKGKYEIIEVKERKNS